MKNKNGFTMVELLAVIVILGILVGVALPNVIGMLDTNKKKAYIQDAKKLIARAQYMVTSDNTKIDKPDPDDCIVLSLGFLDDGSFDSPPNKGEYLSENSFVLVKNIGNNDYEYSAMLIEKYKDSNYYGVTLSTLNQLNASNSNSRVKKITDYNKYNVDDLTINVVNSSIGISNYIKDTAEIIEVYKMYNYEEKTSTKLYNPEISNVKITEVNSNNVKIYVEATDIDSDKLCIDYSLSSDNKKLNYPKVPANVNFSSCNNMELSGGNNFKYTSSNINISSYKPGPMWFLITIYDGEKKYVNKAVKYSFYVNKAPVIDSFTVSKRDNDKNNMNIARLKLTVSDDLDSSSDLDVCISENNNCTNYKKYSELFSHGYYDYKVSDKLDGSSHTLNIFVKDSSNEITSKTANKYVVYKNTAPSITSIIFTPKRISELYPNMSVSDKNSLQSNLKIDVQDDITSSDDLNITIVESGETISTKTTTYDGLHYKDLSEYMFSGNYDGKNRILSIKVCDEDNLCSQSDTKTLNNVFSNKAPIISNNISIKSHLSGFNSKYVEIDSSKLNITDDLNDFQVALCYKIDSGSSICTNYDTLDNFKSLYTETDDMDEKPFIELNVSDYNEQIVKFYINAKDNFGNVVSGDNLTYKLYKLCSSVDSINEYSFVSGKEINADACNGKCFLDSSNNGITANYKKSLYTVDKYVYTTNVSEDNTDESIITYNYTRCSNPNTTSESTSSVNCSFYRCAGEEGTNRFAIGTKLFDVPEEDQWYENLLDEEGNQVYVDSNNNEVSNAFEDNIFKLDESIKNDLVSAKVRIIRLNSSMELEVIDENDNIITISSVIRNKLIDTDNKFIIYNKDNIRISFDKDIFTVIMDENGSIFLLDVDKNIIEYQDSIYPVVCKCDKYYRIYKVSVYSYYAVARPLDPCLTSLCSCIYDKSKEYNSTKNLYKYNSSKEESSYILLNDSTSNVVPSSGLIQIDDSDFNVDFSCRKKQDLEVNNGE